MLMDVPLMVERRVHGRVRVFQVHEDGRVGTGVVEVLREGDGADEDVDEDDIAARPRPLTKGPRT